MKKILINTILYVNDYRKCLQKKTKKIKRKTIQFSCLTNLTVKHFITGFQESTFYLNFSDSHCLSQHEIENSSD